MSIWSTEGRSTCQQLLILLDHIITNSGSQTDVIYLDISKAFDSICHKELLDKVYLIGIKGKCGNGLNVTFPEEGRKSKSTVVNLPYSLLFLEYPRVASWAHSYLSFT